MKSSYLTWRAAKPKQREMSAQIAGHLPAVFDRLRAGYVPPDEDADPFALLLADTEDLLRELGSEVPATDDECVAMQEKIVRPFPLPEGPVTQTQIEELAQAMVLALPEQRMNPLLAALGAYESFMHAALRFELGEMREAMQMMARGASQLSRATYLTACKMASNGGNAKILKNPQAAAKAAAKASAKELWEERRAGKHPSLRTVDHFAMEACRRWPELGSIGTVKKWSERWEREAKEQA